MLIKFLKCIVTKTLFPEFSYTNNFEIVGTWIGAVPGITYSLLAGALSDRYGRKPLLFLPYIGYWISIMIKMVNYAYIE